jgi:hypothetical protein
MSSFDKRLLFYEIFCGTWPRGLDFKDFAEYSIATHNEQARADYPGKAAMSEIWSTKYGLRRVRFDPPTLKEAIAAARGLTDEPQLQTEIAASLMDLPVEAVRAELLKTAPARSSAQIVTNDRRGTLRTVVVERKRSHVRRP